MCAKSVSITINLLTNSLPKTFANTSFILKEQKKAARLSSTQALCAIKIFWKKTLRRTWPAEPELARANPEFKLPVILSAHEVRRILALVKGLDYRVCLTTIYFLWPSVDRHAGGLLLPFPTRKYPARCVNSKLSTSR